MLSTFTAKGFRCFRDFTIGQLERVNLIAGKNNTGKTALLEAIHLHSYPRDCELPFLVNERRGANSERKYDEDSCEWLFFDKNADSEFELRSENDKGEVRTIQIWLLDQLNVGLKFPDLALKAQRMLFPPTDPRFRWIILKTNVDGKETFSFAAPQGTSFQQVGNPAPWNGPSAFISSAGRSPKEDAAVFSDLELASRQDEILPPLRILEPRLQRLSILLLAEQAVMHGNIGLSRQVPVQFMGEGTRRLLSILLAISSAAGGNVLIDEVENGLHYSVLRDVWCAIGEAARRANVQVFATTHSWECIDAAHHAFKEWGPYEFRYHRLDRRGADISVKTFDEKMLDTVEKTDLEVR